MHLPKIPKGNGNLETIKNMSQRRKWLCATGNAPAWKIEEYLAQHEAWKEFEEESIYSHPSWCNPLSRG